MPHQLPDLPYAYDALEPFLNEETMHLHHDKHHAGYVNGLNEAEEKINAAQQSGDFSAIRALCNALAFNYSGHLFHTLFWDNMSPDGGGQPTGELAAQINKDFGSFATFKAQFLAATNSVQPAVRSRTSTRPESGRAPFPSDSLIAHCPRIARVHQDRDRPACSGRQRYAHGR